MEEKLEVTLGTRLAFPATKNNSVAIAYISYKNLRYSFDRSSEKIDGRVLVASPNVKACDFLGFVEHIFFLKLSTTIFPYVVRAKQQGRSMKKTASCKKATELPD